MKAIIEEMKEFLQCKTFIIVLSLVAACSYGYAIMNPIIGMDDTAIGLYFAEGMAPYVGRWTLFVINKFLKLDEFAPWMMELISVLVLMLSVTLWCVLFRRICRKRVQIPLWSWLVVACMFISCPLISEVFVFYLHNGICLSYGLVALAILYLLESVKRETNEDAKQKRENCRDKMKNLVVASVFLTIALGCYESFAIVFVMGAVLGFFLLRRLHGKMGEESEYQTQVLAWIVNGAFVGAVSLVLRTVILKVINVIYGLEKFDFYNVSYRSLFGGLLHNSADLFMVLKRFWLKYYVNAICYLPIRVLVIALVLIGLYGLYHGIRKRDIWLPICFTGIIILPVLMCIIEGVETRYRTAQYVPLIGAFAALLILAELWLFGEKKKNLIFLCCFIFGVLIFNQCANMNKWFYVDDMKYQHFKETMNQVAYDLERDFDTSKPIVLTGAYKVPYEIAADGYSSFSSEEYRWIWLVTDVVDPHLKEKYYASNGKGYVFTETPVTSTLQWGITAFDGTAKQLFEFWEMHGHSFVCETDKEKIAEAEKICKEKQMAGYPEEGYIFEGEEFIIVNLEKN